MQLNTSVVYDYWLISFVRRIGVAWLLGLMLACVIVFFKDIDSSSQIRRGDFPGFFAPAVIVARGMCDSLYDLETQRIVQNEFWPSFKGEFYIYAYPPFVAWILQPLSYFDAITAKLIATLLMLFCGLLSLYVIHSSIYLLREHWVFGVSLAVLFPPLTSGILATQNTAISLLFYVCSVVFLARNSKVCDVIAGVFMGLWLFKPQYAGLMIIASLVIGRPFVLLGVFMPASLYYAIGVHMHGFLWPILWLKSATHFTELNTQNNLRQLVSIWGVGQAVAIAFSVNDYLWKWIARLLSVGVFFVSLFFLRKVIKQKDSKEDSKDCVINGFLWFAPIICIVSPQTLFYDLGICVPTLLWIFGHLTRRILVYISIVYVLVLAMMLIRTYVEYPLFCLVSFTLVVAASTTVYRRMSFSRALS